MSETAPRLNVLITPTPYEGQWRSALTQAAARAGWRFVDAADPAGAGQPIPEDAPALVLTPDVGLAPHAPGAVWAVLADTPEAGLAATAALLGESPPGRQSLRHVSVRLAVATAVAQGGAPVCVAADDRIVLPLLGEVTRTPGGVRPPSAAREAAILGHFQTLPPAPGAAAEWPARIFDFTRGQEATGGDPAQDLTGRGRILMHGPYLEMPPGLWRASVRVAIDPEGGVTPLRFDWCAGDIEPHSAYPLVKEPGEYVIHLDQHWPAHAPAQLRIWVPQGVFQGWFEFLGCRIERLPDPEPEPSPALEQATAAG